MANYLNANTIMNGTFGVVTMNGDEVTEAFGLEAKIELQKEAVKICGSLAEHEKYMGYKGTGTVRLKKTNSRMALQLMEGIKSGNMPEIEIMSELADPAALGAERVLIKGIKFNDLTLANWEAGALGEVEAPFTFTDFQMIDSIDPQ
ncbi:phage tail tube protein [Fusibacter sp. JL216-2]|uniref:phage tail tube protein n=1 Tax=Fusibacter sp. JL216-2 TaxID=3071453 RepID=UPI003D330E41